MENNKRYEDFVNKANQYCNIMKRYLEIGKKFVDPNFHPSLKIKEHELQIDDSINKYKRLEEKYPAPLFKKELIKQGSIGNCYFVTALVRFSKQPTNVVKAFFNIDLPNKILGAKKDDNNK